jgi:hypothetical protein
MMRHEPLSLLEYRWKNRNSILPKHRRNQILKLLSARYMEIKQLKNLRTKVIKSNI